MTQHAQILVWRRRGKWSVKGADEERTFPDQRAAIKAGIEWANETGKNGKPAMVLCRTAKRQFKTIWTYGVDAYPPTQSGLPEICGAAPAG
jgi:hypothetical protein